jgi:hypothetical protein
MADEWNYLKWNFNKKKTLNISLAFSHQPTINKAKGNFKFLFLCDCQQKPSTPQKDWFVVCILIFLNILSSSLIHFLHPVSRVFWSLGLSMTMLKELCFGATQKLIWIPDSDLELSHSGIQDSPQKTGLGHPPTSLGCWCEETGEQSGHPAHGDGPFFPPPHTEEFSDANELSGFYHPCIQAGFPAFWAIFGDPGP